MPVLFGFCNRRGRDRDGATSQRVEYEHEYRDAEYEYEAEGTGIGRHCTLLGPSELVWSTLRCRRDRRG